MTRHGKMGGSATFEFSPAEIRKLRLKRREEQLRWKSLNGPVETRILSEEELAARKEKKDPGAKLYMPLRSCTRCGRKSRGWVCPSCGKLMG